MESILNLIFNAENVRMLALLAFGCSGYVLINRKMDRLDYKIDRVELSLNRRIDGVESSIKSDLVVINGRIDGVEASLNRRIDSVEVSIKELKHNDFAHLNSTIEALTYALEKNGSLKQEDKAYVDSRLAH